MAQYLFLVYTDPAADEQMTPDDWQQMMVAHNEFQEKVVAGGGQILSGEALAPPATATTVRGQLAATTTVTDGPFAELKEAIGGFYVVEAADLDAAIGFARILPTRAGVEVRPVIDTAAGG